MENERELLELAAKAAGIKIIRSRLADPLWSDMLIENSNVENDGNPSARWNPLTEDGDAFRLAGKLRIDFTWQPAMEEVIAYPTMHDTLEITEEYKEYSDHGLPVDTYRYAALRRAIVRAAAEIGRAMQSDKR